MTTVLLRNADRIYTCNDKDEVIEDGYVLIRDNTIEDIGKEPSPIAEADQIHDLSGCLVVPGFVNLHHHFFQSLTRAIPMGQRAVSLDWLAGMYPLWAEFDPEAIYWGALAAAGELLLSGATTSADLAFILPGGHGEAVDEEVRAAQESWPCACTSCAAACPLSKAISNSSSVLFSGTDCRVSSMTRTRCSRAMAANIHRHHDLEPPFHGPSRPRPHGGHLREAVTDEPHRGTCQRAWLWVAYALPPTAERARTGPGAHRCYAHRVP